MIPFMVYVGRLTWW
ncbi:hypothetical protein Nmel_005938 [Mimus melanotis]